jgi:hypothetical protein
MSNISFPCHRICCGRNPNARLLNTKVSKKSSNQIVLPPSLEDQKISNNFSQGNQLIHSDLNIENISTANQIYQPPSDIDLDGLTEEYLQTINEYRFHLGFSSLELSNELNNRALQRAAQLSIQNWIENTNRLDLMYNNEPIGETYEDLKKKQFFDCVSSIE